MDSTRLSQPDTIPTVHAGFPSPAEDHLDQRLDLHQRLVKHPQATYFVRATGESMTPLILPGDLLLVDRSLTPKHGSVVIAVISGGFVCKRFKTNHHLPHLPQQRSFSLTSDNQPQGSMPTHIDPSDDVQIWGVVSSIIRELSR